ncbi:hypothetical protein ENBRE01_0020 [Enteropsectra breve]|nr:hypothetical protein ENBRE01_0020 [Enteropsectra breve]
MLRCIPLKNKALCLYRTDTHAYIGDAKGCVYQLDPTSLLPVLFKNIHAPVSAIASNNDVLYFSTWTGEIHNSKGQHRKLCADIIKTIAIHNGQVFAAAGKTLFIMSPDLEDLVIIESEFKIYSITKNGEEIEFGMSCGKRGTLSLNKIIVQETEHVSSILSVHNDLSGCSDGKVYAGRKLVHQGNGWINSILHENLFSCGSSVVKDHQILYEHKERITGIVELNDMIISTGLDYCYKIYSPNKVMLEDAEFNELFE